MTRTTSDTLRLVAIIGVLLIHGSSYGEWEWVRRHTPGFEVVASILVNQFFRFCVPVFMLLSGFGLYLKYRTKWNSRQQIILGLGPFFADRAYRIALPFIVLSIGILLFNGKFSMLSHGTVNIIPAIVLVFEALSTKPAIYHFYFFTAILQCYLFFPVIFRVTSRQYSGVVLWMALLLLELLYCSPSSGWLFAAGSALPQVPSSSPIYWLFWFYSGMIIAQYDKMLKQLLNRIPGWIVLLFCCISFYILFNEYLFRASYLADPGYFNHFSRWVVIPWAFGVVALFMRFDDQIRMGFDSRPRLSQVVNCMVKISFPTFIWHVWILKLLNMTSLAPHFFLLNTILLCTSFGLVWGVNILLKKPLWLRAALGFG